MRDSFFKLIGTPYGLCLVCQLALSLSARAEEVPEHFTPVRPTGMGGAFTAVANDENMVWTNPAGVGRTRKHRSRSTFHVLRLPSIIVGINKDSRNFYETFKSAGDESVSEAVTQSRGIEKPLYLRTAIFPVVIFDPASRQAPMAAGIYSNTTTKVVIEKASPEEARVEAISDVGGVLTFGFTDQNNRFNAGLQLRPSLRYAYEDRIPSGDLIDKTTMKERFQNDANQMTGIGIDAGVLYTVGDFWFPTIGMSILNIPTGCKSNYLNPFTEKMTSVCGNVYRGEINNPDALSTVDPMDLRTGISITPRFGRSLSMRFALDVHQIALGDAIQSYGLQGIEVSKLIHAGTEFFVGNPLETSPFSLRAGYSQGFVTAGASIDLSFMNLEFATFGRDVSSGARPIEDRRYLASLSLGF